MGRSSFPITSAIGLQIAHFYERLIYILGNARGFFDGFYSFSTGLRHKNKNPFTRGFCSSDCTYNMFSASVHLRALKATTEGQC